MQGSTPPVLHRGVRFALICVTSARNYLSMNYLIILFLVMIYEGGRGGLGLAMHPYRTVRGVARKRWEWPLVLLPGGLLIASLVVGRLGARFMDVPEWGRVEVAVTLATVAGGLLMWQFVVGYLWWRFSRIR